MGNGRALWIPDHCRDWGFDVQVVPEFSRAGVPTLDAEGIVEHHTAGSASGNMPSLRLLREGRPDLAPPLCNAGFARDATVYAIASGRANHAGRGGWFGLEGNSKMLGIEAESTGVGVHPWTPIQTERYPVLVACLFDGLRRYEGVTRSVFQSIPYHYKWTSRKIDPHGLIEPFDRFVDLVEDALIEGGIRPRRRPPVPLFDQREEPMIILNAYDHVDSKGKGTGKYHGTFVVEGPGADKIGAEDLDGLVAARSGAFGFIPLGRLTRGNVTRKFINGRRQKAGQDPI